MEALRAAVRRPGGDWTPTLEAARLAEVRRWDGATMRRALAALGALDAATVARVVLAAAVRDELALWERSPELARWLGALGDDAPSVGERDDAVGGERAAPARTGRSSRRSPGRPRGGAGC
jgi:hypothetical protein